MENKQMAQDCLEWLLQYGSYVNQVDNVKTCIRQVEGNHVWDWWWNIEFYTEEVSSRVDENFIGAIEINELNPFMFNAQEAWHLTKTRSCESWDRLKDFYEGVGHNSLEIASLDRRNITFEEWVDYRAHLYRNWGFANTVEVGYKYRGKGIAKTVYKLVVDWFSLRAAHGMEKKRLRQSFVQLDDGVKLWSGDWARHGLIKRVYNVPAHFGIDWTSRRKWFHYLERENA